MNRRRLCPYAATFVAVALVAISGCTSADPGPATSSTAFTTTSASATTSPSSSPTTPPVSTTTKSSDDPNLPAAARVNSDTGAQEFTKFFLDQVNRAFQMGQVELISPYSGDRCKTCDGIKTAIARYEAKNQHYLGEYVHVSFLTLSSRTGTMAKVFVSTDQPGSKITDANGQVVKQIPGGAGNLSVTLEFKSAWAIQEIQSVA